MSFSSFYCNRVSILIAKLPAVEGRTCIVDLPGLLSNLQCNCNYSIFVENKKKVYT